MLAMVALWIPKFISCIRTTYLQNFLFVFIFLFLFIYLYFYLYVAEI